MKKTQKQMVLEHLWNVGSITGLDALRLFGCYRLSDVIYKLRRDGYNIETIMKEYGDATYAEYRLIKEK